MTKEELEVLVAAIEPASLPDCYSEDPNLIWREDALRALRQCLSDQSAGAMDERQMRELAKTIVDDLFINGLGEEAERLVLTIDKPQRRDLGGWGREAAIDRVTKAMEKIQPASTGVDLDRLPAVPVFADKEQVGHRPLVIPADRRVVTEPDLVTDDSMVSAGQSARFQQDEEMIGRVYGVPLVMQSDEEMVPHGFVSRDGNQPDHDWCKDCAYHRDHQIHVPPPASPAPIVEDESRQAIAAKTIRLIAELYLKDGSPRIAESLEMGAAALDLSATDKEPIMRDATTESSTVADQRDPECGACAEVHFTSVTTNRHTCEGPHAEAQVSYGETETAPDHSVEALRILLVRQCARHIDMFAFLADVDALIAVVRAERAQELARHVGDSEYDNAVAVVVSALDSIKIEAAAIEDNELRDLIYEQVDSGAGALQEVVKIADLAVSRAEEAEALLSATEEAAFKAGFNAGWDADGTPLTFTRQMNEEFAAYRQSKAGSVK